MLWSSPGQPLLCQGTESCKPCAVKFGQAGTQRVTALADSFAWHEEAVYPNRPGGQRSPTAPTRSRHREPSRGHAPPQLRSPPVSEGISPRSRRKPPRLAATFRGPLLSPARPAEVEPPPEPPHANATPHAPTATAPRATERVIRATPPAANQRPAASQ